MRFANTKVSFATALAILSVLILTAALPASAQTETVLYSFGSQSGDGAYPEAGLVLDGKGNLYGTTYQGGLNNWGTVFKVTPAGVETVLYRFGNGFEDGYWPFASLVRDGVGNLYGTTDEGLDALGTVFKVTRAGVETVLYQFGFQSGDGAFPDAGLLMDKLGNLYGTTSLGGAANGGTVFKVTLAGGETVLYSFQKQSGDGYYPEASLIMDKEGNLYGTTDRGGANDYGTVFKVTRAGGETVLHSFGSQSGDGRNPVAGLVVDQQGNLYGTTSLGGAENWGTVYKISPAGVETVLHSFGTQYDDAFFPLSGLIMDKQGNFYGTTAYGGVKQCGTVYKLIPAGTLTVLYKFGSQSGDGCSPVADLVMDKLGNLYGTTRSGGAFGYGTVFRVFRVAR